MIDKQDKNIKNENSEIEELSKAELENISAGFSEIKLESTSNDPTLICVGPFCYSYATGCIESDESKACIKE
ncbi:MAG: hypothetical protein MJ247_05250 [Alphaproteobacteria bacterium]|nr:hypothetical protein [Alphaproteobacteria bacterium]